MAVSTATTKKPRANSRAAMDEVPQQEVDLTPQEGRLWYVIHTYSGYENKVKANLEHRIESMDVRDRIFQVVIPTEEEIEIRDGQRRTVSRKRFPGYVLVDMLELKEGDEASNKAWYVVRNTPGVTGFVGSGNKPVPLDQGEVKQILRQMKTEEPRVRVNFQPGDPVRIIDGPFQDFSGQVDEINLEKGKVKVLVSFFGRETPVELDFLQVERDERRQG
jgi:transcription termination/antitermination protein NusG